MSPTHSIQKPTLLNILSLGNSLADLILITFSSFRDEGLMKTRSKIVKAEGILSSQIQKLCHSTVSICPV